MPNLTTIPKTKTRVTFYVDKGSTNVYAYFNDIKENKYLKRTYEHVGQHSAGSITYARTCKKATREQYQSLLNELIGLGYNDLIILNKE